MICRTRKSWKFKTKLGFKQHDVINRINLDEQNFNEPFYALNLTKHSEILFKVQQKYRKCKLQSDKNKKKTGRLTFLAKCGICSSKKIKIYEKTRSKTNIK